MEKWLEIRKPGNYKEMGERLHISPVTARILRNRDLLTDEDIFAYLKPEEFPEHDGKKMGDLKKAASIIAEKIAEGKKIRIIGDYDVDGISSTYILYKAISLYGGKADYRIPHRIEDGYGINIKMIDEAIEAGIDTIITCDNGISAFEQVNHAKENNLTVVITDHHEIPFEEKDGIRKYIIPNADAVADPKKEGDSYPFSGICGAMVAFKFSEVLWETVNDMPADRIYIPAPKAYNELKLELTEFAALATVCDVMELKDENRSIVTKGMSLMADSRNKGLRALIDVTGLKGRKLTSYSLGFVIGPCLNASGRLDTSLKALELFTEENESLIYERAAELKNLNEERKEMTTTELSKAVSIVDGLSDMPGVLVVYLPDCHESLAGIIAGRLREKYTRPTFVVTRTQNGLKGSGRSIDAYDMYENLIKVSHLLSKFGGHKLAAGISLPEENLSEFIKELNDNCSLSEDDFCETIRIDMELPFDYANLSLARELERLEPFGTGNAKPLFARGNVTLISGSYLGKTGCYGKYKVTDDSGKVYEMLYFGDAKAFEEYVSTIYSREEAKNLHKGVRVNIKLAVVYEIGVNEFRGNESAQIIMNYYR